MLLLVLLSLSLFVLYPMDNKHIISSALSFLLLSTLLSALLSTLLSALLLPSSPLCLPPAATGPTRSPHSCVWPRCAARTAALHPCGGPQRRPGVCVPRKAGGVCTSRASRATAPKDVHGSGGRRGGCCRALLFARNLGAVVGGFCCGWWVLQAKQRGYPKPKHVPLHVHPTPFLAHPVNCWC